MPLSLIPQVFYDVIARVIPGFVVMVMWYLTIAGPSKAVDTIVGISAQATQDIFNFWSFAALFTIAYLVGFSLAELWRLTFRRVGRRKKRNAEAKYMDACLAQNDQMRKCLGQRELGLERQDLPPFHIVHDHLRLHSESEAYRLLKLRAEARLCEVLFVGLLPLPAINALFWYRASRLSVADRMILELALIVAIVMFWTAGQRLNKFYIGGTCTSWLLHSFPIEPVERIEPPSTRSSDAPAE